MNTMQSFLLTQRHENSRKSKQISWKTLVEEEVEDGKLKVKKCSCYSISINEDLDDETKCICGRLARRHSFTGEPQRQYRKAKRWRQEIASAEDVTVYGQLGSGARFIRCYMESDETFKTLTHIIARDVERSKPKLLVSCYGGAEYFKMTDKLEREFLNGIGQLAATKDVWLLTTGINSGVSKLIGRGIRRNKLLNGSPSKMTVIGMSHWGTLSEYTRQKLKSLASSNMLAAPFEMTPFSDKNDSRDLDKYHTHFLLYDDGRVDNYLTDDPRSDFVLNTCDENCYAVTIIVEGGINSLEVIFNDLKEKRPVVIVHGSGRLADVLGNLLENTTNSTIIGQNQIEQQLELISTLWPQIRDERQDMITNIEKVLDLQFRPYLTVFRLGEDASLTNTIFRAVLQTQTESQNKKKLLELAVNWNCLDGAQYIFKSDSNFRRHYPSLFEQALKENRPMFVDHFLRGYHNPLETTAFVNYRNTESPAVQKPSTNKYNYEDEKCVASALQFIIKVLYRTNGNTHGTWYPSPQTFEDLKQHYSQLIGPYAESFYDEINVWKRLRRELKFFFYSRKLIRLGSRRVASTSEMTQEIVVHPPANLTLFANYYCSKPYDEQGMLRDLFLWSVYMDYADIAFVLLLQLKSRIGAALLAAGIAQRLSLSANSLDQRNTYDEHRIAYEDYAKACIEACYKHNEQFACQLLLREIPLFGNITCMQAAIASRNIPFINTNCFDQVLNQQWYGHLENTSSSSISIKYNLLLHLMLFGLLAPVFLDYDSGDDMHKLNQKDDIEYVSQNKIPEKPWKGIEDQSMEQVNYWIKLKFFHASPFVKVFYQFLIYIWFLLVFSYMMLFQMRAPLNGIHWTEIYVIISVSAALLEDFRKICCDFYTQMTERWHKTDSWILSMYALPYVLFYIGIGLHFGSIVRPELFTAARIVLAIDLEVWYLFSLRYVSAIKLWGPKLFMIRNMMHDLAGFIYIIFVCITAYGVVSSALTMYSSIELTTKNMSSTIFYRPYWFLYDIVDDEKAKLDDIILSDSNAIDQKIEAIIAQILLAFHMLFINILILNLLIAVFNFSINDVQAKNQYFWRYQRYELIREYFEKPTFAYPPLSLLVYIWLFFKLCTGRKVCKVFKRLATTTYDEKWTEYENEATYNHARTFVESKYRLKNTTDKSSLTSSLIESKDELTLQRQVNTLTEKVTQMHHAMNIIQEQTKQMMLSIVTAPEAPSTSEHIPSGVHNISWSINDLKVTVEKQLEEQNKKLNDMIHVLNDSSARNIDPVSNRH